MEKASIEDLESQIKSLQTEYDYNLKEYPIEVILKKFKHTEDYIKEKDKDESTAMIFIPKYQRAYVWQEDMRCKFIESLFLGVPIPPLISFTVDESGNMELIDGVQRISTINQFVQGKLKISNLELLDNLNGYKFKELHPARQRKFNSLSIRMFVFSEKADEGIRADIYNRINSTGVRLTDAEIRKGSFLGNKFYEFILECIDLPDFNELYTPTKRKADKLRGEKEELVSRFFAYSEDYKTFVHSVKHFINEYIIKKGKDGFDHDEKLNEFKSMLAYVKKYFPYGFRKTPASKSYPRVRFEAIAIGVNLALKENPDLGSVNMDWLNSVEFKEHTTSDASNNKSKLTGRIEFVRDCLLGVANYTVANNISEL